MKEQVIGWFCFEEPAHNSWTSYFTVEDDDGMSLVLDTLKKFHGLPVTVTVEVNENLKPDFGPTAYVYDQLGMTAKNVRAERDLEREAMLKKDS